MQEAVEDVLLHPFTRGTKQIPASQSLLELDGGVKVLVDVGWDAGFDTRQLAEIEKNTSSLSFILLTHATLEHLGAYAHCCKYVPYFSQIPVYATSPVIAFGRTLLQDLYLSTPLAATFIPSSASPEDRTAVDDQQRTNILRQPPTSEEIAKYFSLITPLKYSQPHQPAPSQFSAPLEGLTLTAYNAGHTLGGTIWHIQHGMESIVYAVDWNQAKENVMAGAAWFGGVGGSEVIEQLRKPTALICSSVGGDRPALAGGRKARDDALLNHIRSCLAKGGTVLIPTDSSARILELAWVLEKAWHENASQSPFKESTIYMASKSAHATIRHAKSLLEWMDDSIVREFEGEEEVVTKTHKRSGSKQVNGNTKPSRPFEFRHIKLVEKQAQLERVLKGEGPRVILASDLSMDWGCSKSMFDHVSQSANNLVLLTERPTPDKDSASLNQVLWRCFETKQDGVALEKTIGDEQIEQVHGGGQSIIIHVIEKSALDDRETQQYQQYVATQRQMQAALAEKEMTGEAVDDNIDDSSSSSSDESDEEQQGRALNVSAALGHSARNKITLNDEDLGVSVLIRKKGAYDFDVRDKKGRNAVFPYTHPRKRGDDYGDFIKPEDFLREEEKEEQDAAANAKAADSVGKKRKWDEDLRQKGQQNKKQRVQRSDSPESEDSEGSAEEEAEELPGLQGPVKAVSVSKTIPLNSRLAFVDFAGLHDQRSLQMLIPLIGPKKLILTGGSAEETKALALDCKELLGIKVVGADQDPTVEIFTPDTGMSVDASVDTNAWIVKLSHALAKTLNWQEVEKIKVLTLQGQLKGESEVALDIADDPKTKKVKVDTEIAREGTPELSSVIAVLDELPSAMAASVRSVAQPIHVGDTRLADLRRIMNSTSHTAEFRGAGTLVVDGVISVKKLPTGKIVIEGAPVNAMSRSYDSFSQVKRMIYHGLAVVAAG